MAHRVVWSSRAIADLEAIANYIAADSQKYAATVVRKILKATRTLAAFPNSGRKVPEFDDETVREVFAYSYRIIYKIDGVEITVATVITASNPSHKDATCPQVEMTATTYQFQ
jgi:toxin ParE1/3/4